MRLLHTNIPLQSLTWISSIYRKSAWKKVAEAQLSPLAGGCLSLLHLILVLLKFEHGEHLETAQANTASYRRPANYTLTGGCLLVCQDTDIGHQHQSFVF